MQLSDKADGGVGRGSPPDGLLPGNAHSLSSLEEASPSVNPDWASLWSLLS